MEFLKINSKTVAPPSSIEHTFEILDKAERTMDGTMVIDEIGKKNVLSVKWDYLTKEEMSFISSELNKAAFATVSYKDKTSGDLVTITARPQNFKYSPAYDWTNDKVLWKSVSVSFSER